ncbi:hypothetical protein O3M35_009518 [Rhynocoris fuscipes]|uniref:C2H2-type domain-containing protein n=1 Tax=Rhynocoris fuscipes TaxID=488301 RepID=A0AAW1DA55_9HEMI
MENHLIACPVCTLYLREGMSMQSHLNTHPKDQVIDALVRMCTTDRAASVQHESQSPAIFNPFHVVSEEHIILGRQQVTNIIHTPVLPYIYQQQPQPMVSDYMGQTSESARGSESLLSLGQNGSGNGSALLTTLVNVQDEGAVGITDMLSSKLNAMNNDNSKCYIEVQNAITSVTQRTEIQGKPEIAAQVRPAENADQYITSDCDYQDEDARHSEDLDDPGYGLDECNSKLTADERSCLSNLRSAGSSPHRIELSGNSSLHASNNSVWVRDNLVASPNEEDAFKQMESETPQPAVTGTWEPSLPSEKKPDIKKSYQCSQCSQIFSCPKERRVHMASLHCDDSKPKRREPLCTKCDLKFPTLKELKAHNRLLHNKSSRQCGVCLEEFISIQQYSEHISKVHPLECRICGKTFHTKAGLSSHSKIHMALKPHACSVCPKTFITVQKLREHMNGHTGIAPIQCTMCDRRFKRYSNLKQHKDIAHYSVKKKVKEFFCECGETFASKKKLEWHKETHADKPKQCMYCSERYIHNASLTRHIRRAHNNEYIPPSTDGQPNIKRKNVVCQICNLTFLDSSLRAHMKQHSNIKQFGCIVCGKKFHTKWNLSLHKWTHASRMSKPFKCTMCKGAFLRQSELQAHIRAHYGNKPYTCNHCGMQFNRKHNWLRHEKEHLMEKKYTCQECGKSFHRNYYLVDHARVHTGVKPYSCHICNKTSSTKSNHNKHVRTHHAREAVNTEA